MYRCLKPDKSSLIREISRVKQCLHVGGVAGCGKGLKIARPSSNSIYQMADFFSICRRSLVSLLFQI